MKVKVKRCLVIVVLSVTVCVNVMFIMDVNHKLREEGLEGDGDGESIAGDALGDGFMGVPPLPRALTIEVYSSQSKVTVSVDGTVVSLSLKLRRFA
ncbi:protein O-linked-mannose beta-1 [Tropilaelaps mercedesae]|uniref:Protein O-linked-mannose beta-1 n=1 Tax=Tropilaelaps mercedesae TaxID=418985 RepID=A0A1V9XZ44_9ACAR|nr:protein O-linked-mannose beta-1 [Tropilaelaps mercedesae]